MRRILSQVVSLLLIPASILAIVGVEVSAKGNMKERPPMNEKRNLLLGIEILAKADVFDVATVERALGKRGGFAKVSENEFFSVLESVDKGGGAIDKIELRIPTGFQKGDFLVVSVSPRLAIGLEDIKARFGKNPSLDAPNPHAPADSPWYHTYESAGGRVSFGMQPGASGKLVDVVFDKRRSDAR